MYSFATALSYEGGIILNTLNRKRNVFIFVALVIPVILALCFVIYPSFDLLKMSFTSWDGISPNRQFIGLENYRKMFMGSPELWQSLRNNMIYFIMHFLFIPIELALAVMLTTKFKGAGFFKSVIFLPYVINGVAIAYAFSYFFSPINGAFNEILTLLGMEGAIRSWLSDKNIVNIALGSVSIWRYAGYHVIMFIAALASIPSDILEAAEVDGASAWQKLRYIQIPSIQLVIDFILFDNVRGALQVFDLPFVMTAGGPGYASSTFTMLTINTAFKFNNFGMAATMAITIMLLIVIIYFIQSKVIAFCRGERR